MRYDFTRPAQVPATEILQAPDRTKVGGASKLLGHHPATTWRWTDRGVVGADGVRRYLPCARVGHSSWFSRALLLEFVDVLAHGTDARKHRRPAAASREHLVTQGVLQP